VFGWYLEELHLTRHNFVDHRGMPKLGRVRLTNSSGSVEAVEKHISSVVVKTGGE